MVDHSRRLTDFALRIISCNPLYFWSVAVVAMVCLSACGEQARDLASTPSKEVEKMIPTGYIFPESHRLDRMHLVGARTCGECHAEAVAEWRKSHHALANRAVSRELDGSAFKGVRTLTEGDTVYRMIEQDGEFWVHVKTGDAATRSFKLEGVIGTTPLRQYLAVLPGNRFQTLSASYDVLNDKWFHVFEGEGRRLGEWGHWEGQGMNWNSNCAECHMTEYRKGFDFEADAFRSDWTEQGVSCAECHGDLDKHVVAAHAGDFTILPKVLTREQTEHTCAACHSRRDELSANEFRPGENYYDHYSLTLPDTPSLYYPDGQILDEVFVYGSFKMSRMAHSGVSCMDCHNPHSLELKYTVQDNALCMQCHEAGNQGAPIIEPRAHSFHAEESTGNQCVSCHMPQTSYMIVDPRADHGFHSPDPRLTLEQGTPNACNRCHEDQTVEWAVEWTEKWYGLGITESRQRRRARAIYSAYRGEVFGFQELLKLSKDEEIPAWSATFTGLLRQHGNDPQIQAIVEAAAAHPHPLVQERAAGTIGDILTDESLVMDLLKNDRTNVRLAAARSAFLFRHGGLGPALEAELRRYFAFHMDRPLTLFVLAQDAQRNGRANEVLKLVKRAIALDRENSEMYRQGAIILSGAGLNDRAAEMLRKGQAFAPDNPIFPYSIALISAEEGRMEKAIEGLQEALRMDPQFVRAWYNLSLALQRVGRTEEAKEAMLRVQMLQSSAR